jgi:hypothetical protein
MIQEVWVAAAALLALQIGAFTWRISREIDVAEGSGDINWLPWADRMNMVAMVSSLAVFILPLLACPASWPEGAFLFSVVLSMGYPFAVASHYDLWHEGKRDIERGKRCGKIAAMVTLLVALLMLILFAAGASFCQPRIIGSDAWALPELRVYSFTISRNRASHLVNRFGGFRVCSAPLPDASCTVLPSIRSPSFRFLS